MKDGFLSTCLAFFIKQAAALLFSTLKVETTGQENFLEVIKDHKCLLVLWHENVIMTPTVLSQLGTGIRFSAMVSNSKDAAPLAKWVESYKNGTVIRVPHDARGDVFRALVKRLQWGKEIIVLTPDGPRGPAKVIKKGAVQAAIQTGAAVVPFSWNASKTWRLNTWDGLKIPRPFSKLEVKFGPPVFPEEEESAFVEKIESQLNLLEV